ncbi:MAG TPA: DUF992 domain-containing protein [Xanthobacteraceae bacterium]|nr:DUF992 domain-containing protein [Xanthobacteraceae bacterium]
MYRPLHTLAAAVVAALVAGTAAIVPAAAQSRVKVGTLTCDISGGLGLIVASQKLVRCTFTPSVPGPQEVYFGTINKLGIDIGSTTGGSMLWTVYAPTSLRVGALAGHYTGASAEATVGLGAGANILVGGSDRTVTLQPISVQGQTGLNLAVAVASLELRRAR